MGGKPEVMRGEKGTGTPVAGKVMEVGAHEADWTAGWLVQGGGTGASGGGEG